MSHAITSGRVIAPPSCDALARVKRLLSLGAMRLLGIGLQFALQALVSVLGGAAALGMLQLLTSWLVVTGEVIGRGFASQGMRIAASAGGSGPKGAGLEGTDTARGESGQALLCHLTAARSAVLKSALFLAALIALVSILALGPQADDWVAGSAGVLVCALFFSFQRQASEALKGLGYANFAINLESALLPTLMMAGCLACFWLSGELDPYRLSTVVAAAFLVTALCLWHRLARELPVGLFRGESAGEGVAKVRERRNLWACELLNIAYLQCPVLLLPLFSDLAVLGHYALAFKLVGLVTTVLLVLAAVYGPRFTTAFEAGDRAALQQLLRETQLYSSAVFVPFAIVLLLCVPTLAEVFNVQSAMLMELTALLLAAQFFNAITGIPGVLLTMTGHAEMDRNTLLLSVALLAGSCLLLGFFFGASGVAVGVLLGTAFRNLWAFRVAQKLISKLGD